MPEGRAERAVEAHAQGEEHSRQSHSTHHTEEVTVHYPWHPLHGQTILVQRSVRHGREVWLCEHDQRTAAIPVWMTDRVACAALSLGPVLVSVDAIVSLPEPLLGPLGKPTSGASCKYWCGSSTNSTRPQPR